jgi:hypothetical protein
MAGMLDYNLFDPKAINKIKGSLKKHFDTFQSKVKALFSTEVCGSIFDHTHWQFPVDKNENSYYHCVCTMNISYSVL